MNIKKRTRFLSIIMAIVLCISGVYISDIPVKAATIVDSGVVGDDNIQWTFDSDGVLTLSGTGEIPDFGEDPTSSPWYKHRNKVRRIVFSEGITKIGLAAFSDMSEEYIDFPTNSLKTINYSAFTRNNNLKEVIIPNSVTVLNDQAFYMCGSIHKVYVPGSIKDIRSFAFTWLSAAFVTVDEGCETMLGYSFEGSVNWLSLPSTIKNIASDFNGSYGSAQAIYGRNQYTKERCETIGLNYIDATQNYNLSSAKLNMSGTKFTYTGQAITPLQSVTYTHNGKEIPLYEGYDYDISYSNNVSVGTVTATLTGKNCYIGTKQFTYDICVPMEQCNMSLEYDSTLYTGSAITPKATVKYGSDILKEGVDYTLSYSNNTNEGTATVTATGIGRCLGTVSKSFTISKDSILASNISLEYSSIIADGTEKRPTVTVKNNSGGVLSAGTDYTLEYSADLVNAGPKTITVTGSGKYKGTVSLNYNVTSNSIENADIALKKTIYTYDGSPKRPSVVVKIGQKVLEINKDYTVSYKDNIDNGTAQVIIVGTGIYSGAVSCSFVILPYNPGMEAVYDEGTLVSGKYVYGIMDDDNNEVELCCPATKQNISNMNIPSTVKDEDGNVYTVTSIGQKAFYKNTKIQTLTIGNKVKSIENYAFYGCKNLKKLTIGSSVDIIGPSSFRNCTKLTNVTIPKSVDELGKNAFYGCKKLSSITIKATKMMDVEDNAIKGISKKAIIKVPKKFYKKYKKEFSKKTGFTSSMKIKKLK